VLALKVMISAHALMSKTLEEHP